MPPKVTVDNTAAASAANLSDLPPIQLAIRSNTGITFQHSPFASENDSDQPATRPSNSEIPSADVNGVYSTNGALFAVIRSAGVDLYDSAAPATEPSLVRSISRANILVAAFSPSNTFLVTFDRKSNTNTTENLNIWRVADGSRVIGWHQAREVATIDALAAQFSQDDRVLCHAVNNEVQVYDTHAIIASIGALSAANIAHKFHHPGLANFALSPAATDIQSLKIAIFSPVRGAEPARVSVYTSHSNTALVSKSFFRAEEASLRWNTRGDALLVSVQTATDTSGKSYYGESHLALLLAADSDAQAISVDFDGNTGPVLDFAFSPSGKEFLVVQGFQPAKSVLYDTSTGKATKQYGRGPRNTIRWSPHGRFLAIGGFGNLAGEIDFYDAFKFRLLGQCQDRDGAKSFEWTPDSRHFITAVLRPWRRVDNGFKVWSYAGELVRHTKYEQLYQVAVRPPQSLATYPNRPQSPRLAAARKDASPTNAVGTTGQAKPKPNAAYVPPHLRSQAAATNTVSAKINEERTDGGGLKKLGAAPKPKTALTPEQRAEQMAKQKAAEEKKRLAAEVKAREDAEVAEHARLDELESTQAGCEAQLKKATKKLKSFQQLQKKAESGAELDDDQRAKLARAAEFTGEVDRLTAKLATFTT